MFRINEYLEHFPNEKVQLIWHGGEPLLLGVDFFKRIHKMQNQICQHTMGRLDHAIQSNMTLLNEEFICVLKKLNVRQLGTSYDPENHIRGFGPNRDSQTYNKRFMDGDILSVHHGMSSGVIYVVTKKSLAEPMKIFHFLNNLKPGGGFNLNPVLIYGDDPHKLAITPGEYVAFLREIFPHWWKHRERYPMVQPFLSYKENIVDGKQSLGCVFSGTCAFSQFNINTNGDISQCGRASDWDILDYGNIFERSLADTLENPARVALDERADYLKTNDCRQCRFWGLCHGGCPLDAWSDGGNMLKKTPWCYTIKGFVSEIFEPVTGYIFNGLETYN